MYISLFIAGNKDTKGERESREDIEHKYGEGVVVLNRDTEKEQAF